jgi:hypothetical protein
MSRLLAYQSLPQRCLYHIAALQQSYFLITVINKPDEGYGRAILEIEKTYCVAAILLV